jgi:phage shock protein A
MPFDPTKPANGSLIAAAELRAQFTALDADIQQRATNATVAAAIASTSSNSNAVDTLSQSADASYNQSQMQSLLDKVDELINALRR